MIILILTYLVFIICDAWFQSRLIKRGVWIKHGLHALIAIGVAVGLALIHTWQIAPLVVFTAFLLALRWLVFDISLNLFRKRHWLYAGTPDKNDSFIDSLPWGENPGRTMLFVKIGLLILLTVLLINL